MEYFLFPIGKVDKKDNINSIVIDKKYAKGLKSLGLFSHAIVIYSQNMDSRVPFLHRIIKINSVEEKKGIIYFDESHEFYKDDIIYDIKPYFPCEDRVKECFTQKEGMHSYLQLNLEPFEVSLTGDRKIKAIGNIRRIKGEFFIDVCDELKMKLEKLKRYSHIKIFWWFSSFDKSKYRIITECDPPYENAPRTGIFASRSPVRPNPIALTTARIISIDEELGRIKVSGLDCFNNTPLIEISTYNKVYDRVLDFKVPKWLEHWPEWLEDGMTKPSADEVSLKPSSLDIIKKYLRSGNKNAETIDIFNVQNEQRCQKRKGIEIIGAKQNNLKNINVTIPYNKITAITGVSGSGKSSLAFDTIFAESQRSFSNILGSKSSFYEQISAPSVDRICGILPSISVSQKNIARNPRSTVGTMTGLYDCLRTLFASIGVRHCPECGAPIVAMTAEEIEQILSELALSTIVEITPFAANNICYEYVTRESITNNEILLKEIKKSLEEGKGAIYVTINHSEKLLFQTTQMCYCCKHILFELTPAVFSYNNTESMCPVCNGLGIEMKIDTDSIVSHPELSILDGASSWWGNLRRFKNKPNGNWMKGEVLALAEEMKVDLEKPWNKLPKEFKKQAVWGSGGRKVTFKYDSDNGRNGIITRPVEGAYNYIKRTFYENSGEAAKRIVNQFMKQRSCSCCHGERLSKEGRSVEILGTTFPKAAAMTISELKEWVYKLPKSLSEYKLAMVSSILKELYKKLCSYIKIGLPYLNLNRSLPTLSGGELQRLRLVLHIGIDISNILYVLDEPSTGLHPKDYKKLIEIIKEIRDNGNTVVIVDHNIDFINAADLIIDVGPGAGIYGGEIIAEGTPIHIVKNKNSITGQYMSGEKKVRVEKKGILKENKWVKVAGIRCNNLKNINISFPIGSITCVSGVSGSGKSSLVSKVLYPAFKARIDSERDISEFCDVIIGDQYFHKVIYVTQSPIGRTPRSNPATYTGAMDEIRKIFVATEESKERGYKINQFSFNSKEGQCPKCCGEGRIRASVSFMEDIWAECPVCKGKRYKNDVLQVKYKDKNIYEVLEMNIVDALALFKDYHKLKNILGILCEVGLGYLKLGQSALTLSGGEAQRIKLAKELCEETVEKTLYILDEPTTGLHFSDVQKLLILLEKIKSRGNTILIVEHNLDIIRNADWIIDLGPEGGNEGGYVTAEGTPEEVAKVNESYTGKLLSISAPMV